MVAADWHIIVYAHSVTAFPRGNGILTMALFVLAIWSMKETAEAAKRGERIPPTYHNITGKFARTVYGNEY